MTTLNIDPTLSIYIPVVFDDVTKDTIKDVFQSLAIGDVSRVDFVTRPLSHQTPRHTTRMAFVHFNKWHDNVTTEHLQERLLAHDREARLVYDEPHYWILRPNTNPLSEHELLTEDKLNCQLAMIQDLQARVHMLETTLTSCVDSDAEFSNDRKHEHCGICLTETDNNRDDCGACLAPLPPPALPHELVVKLSTNTIPDDIPIVQAIEERRAELLKEIHTYKSTLTSPPLKMTINHDLKILYLYRGPQGVGKDYAADEKIEKDGTGVKYPIEEYFYVEGFLPSEFVWAPDKFQDASAWNKNRTLVAMKNNKGPIHVPNTFAKASEMKFYVKHAIRYGYKIEITELFSDDVDYLFKNNIHNITREAIQTTCDNFERDLSVQDILDAPTINSLVNPNEHDQVNDSTREPEPSPQLAQETGWKWFG